MTAVGDIICMKVGAEKVNDLPDINDEDEKNSNLKKHRVFDKEDQTDTVNDEDEKNSNLKKHRVFDKEKDKGKDKKGILDWLF